MPLPSRLIPSTPAAPVFHHYPSPRLPPISFAPSSSLCPPRLLPPCPCAAFKSARCLPAISPFARSSLPRRAGARGAVRWARLASWISRGDCLVG
ncbi:hypothetical protein BAE44_0004259 [Dichanthelium oligosanthes]|uniref:Uncharacterized protein n=1 Tax=Dichanthelium oligosanthes TaxID=888268 RepID=A0A1E5WBF2_9POAL|nr:hypothetical protein BAE44_0004259 [Dichanthelium oligosanthes]